MRSQAMSTLDMGSRLALFTATSLGPKACSDSFMPAAGGQSSSGCVCGSVHLALGSLIRRTAAGQVIRQFDLIQSKLLEHRHELMMNQRIKLPGQTGMMGLESLKADRLALELTVDRLQHQLDSKQGLVRRIPLAMAAAYQACGDLILGQLALVADFSWGELELDFGAE